MPTKAEKEFHDLLCRVVGCAACRFGHGIENAYCSIHHIDGRTKPGVEWLTLGMCGSHHQTGAGGVEAVHLFKKRFEKRYGTERELLARSIKFIQEAGYELPEEAMRNAA